MGSISKSFALVLILVMAVTSLSLMMIKPAYAQTSASAPSVPTFTVKFIDASYSVPTTYGVDPYTGKTIMTQSSYCIQNKSIEVSIKNQPFTPYTDVNGNYVSLYYNVSFKGYFASNWIYYDAYEGYWYKSGGITQYLKQSNTSYTVLDFGFVGDNGTDYYAMGNIIQDVLAGGQIDFRVQAYLAYFTTVSNPPIISPSYSLYRIVVNLVSASTWSKTQTLTMPAGSTSPIPTVPEFPTLTILPFLFALPLLAIIVPTIKKGKAAKPR
jgi:hypothetical protein